MWHKIKVLTNVMLGTIIVMKVLSYVIFGTIACDVGTKKCDTKLRF